MGGFASRFEDLVSCPRKKTIKSFLAHSSTLHKLSSFRNTLFGLGQDNAFVRISTSLEGKGTSEAKELIFEFIRDFYPLYLEYIRQNTSESA